jgi:hypothetical protein
MGDLKRTKDRRQTCKKLGSGGLALRWRHPTTSLLLFYSLKSWSLDSHCPMFLLISSIILKVLVFRLADTWQQQPRPPAASFLYMVANKEVEQQFSGRCDIVGVRNRKNLWLLLSGDKYLRKSSCATSCPCPLLWLELCQLSLKIIWHSYASVKFS